MFILKSSKLYYLLQIIVYNFMLSSIIYYLHLYKTNKKLYQTKFTIIIFINNYKMQTRTRSKPATSQSKEDKKSQPKNNKPK